MRSYKRITDAMRLDALRSIRDGKETPVAVSKRLGCTDGAVYSWLRKKPWWTNKPRHYAIMQQVSNATPGNSSASSVQVMTLAEENKTLTAENERMQKKLRSMSGEFTALREERDAFKTVVLSFAREAV